MGETKMTIAVIGGSGFEKLAFLKDPKNATITTPYGKAKVITGKIASKRVVFLSRHGSGHEIPPHMINYRANIYALKKMNVKYIIATAIVGAMDKKIKPGNIDILSDYIDFTKSRQNTFSDAGKVIHVDMSQPYSDKMNKIIAGAIKRITNRIPRKLIYAATEGPRFETKAEIKMFKNAGAHVVGMTGVPEVALANELGIPYAAITLSTNYAAGISKENLSMNEIFRMIERRKALVCKIIEESVKKLYSA